ncbi:hypothetical protein BC830DRAFT_428849 [Chytriomyces sp. MP71]|nr:hypothetical protein BC830DRAFT_428849 [Chytriomyces sp. MP71]
MHSLTPNPITRNNLAPSRWKYGNTIKASSSALPAAPSAPQVVIPLSPYPVLKHIPRDQQPSVTSPQTRKTRLLTSLNEPLKAKASAPPLKAITSPQKDSPDWLATLSNLFCRYQTLTNKPDPSLTLFSNDTPPTPISIPLEIAHISETLRHIHAASKFFSASTGDCISLPYDAAVLSQVTVFLYEAWIARADVVSPAPRVQLILQDTLRVMDAALYLDLPALVDVCSQTAARHFQCTSCPGTPLNVWQSAHPPRNTDIEDFTGLATVLTLDILKRLPAHVLFEAERDPRLEAYAGDMPRLWAARYAMVEPDARARCTRLASASSLRKACVPAILGRHMRVGEWERAREVAREVAAEALVGKVEVEAGWGPEVVNVLQVCGEMAMGVCVRVRGVVEVGVVRDVVAGVTGVVEVEFPCGQVEGNVGYVLGRLGTMQTREDMAGMGGLGGRRKETSVLRKGTTADSVPSSLTCQEVHLKLVHDATGLHPLDLHRCMTLMAPLPSITTLNLSGLSFLPGDARILASYIDTHSALTTVLLDNCKLGGAGISTLAAKASMLVHLDVGNNVAPGDPQAAEAAFAVARWLSSGTCRCAKLRIHGNAVGAGGGVAIAQALARCKSLQEVDLSRVDLGLALVEVCGGIRKGLRRLEVDGCGSLPRIVTEALESLGRNQACKELKRLGIGLNAIPPNLALLLSGVFENAKSLTHLGLKGCDKWQLGDHGCERVLDALRGNQTLVHIDLSFNGLRDRSCRAISDLLSECKLQEVMLAGNLIADEGVRHFLKLLKRGWERRLLVDMEGNCIGAEVRRLCRRFECGKQVLHVVNQREF